MGWAMANLLLRLPRGSQGHCLRQHMACHKELSTAQRRRIVRGGGGGAHCLWGLWLRHACEQACAVRPPRETAVQRTGPCGRCMSAWAPMSEGPDQGMRSWRPSTASPSAPPPSPGTLPVPTPSSCLGHASSMTQDPGALGAGFSCPSPPHYRVGRRASAQENYSPAVESLPRTRADPRMTITKLRSHSTWRGLLHFGYLFF